MTKLDGSINKIITRIKTQLPERANQVAIELRNSELKINSGPRSGRTYVRYGRVHTASAPGEPPAVDTGAFRNSWQPLVVSNGSSIFISKIKSTKRVGGMNHGDMLEYGTPGGKIAPRPYADKTMEMTKEKAVKIYKRKYF